MNQIIEIFDDYAVKNKIFEEFQKRVEIIRKKYPLNETFNNYTQDPNLSIKR